MTSNSNQMEFLGLNRARFYARRTLKTYKAGFCFSPRLLGLTIPRRLLLMREPTSTSLRKWESPRIVFVSRFLARDQPLTPVQSYSMREFIPWERPYFPCLKPSRPVKQDASLSARTTTVSVRVPLLPVVSSLTSLIVPWYHADQTLWPNVEDPALEHPMTPRLVRILQTYERLSKETGKEQPMLKPARYDMHNLSAFHEKS